MRSTLCLIVCLTAQSYLTSVFGEEKAASIPPIPLKATENVTLASGEIEYLYAVAGSTFFRFYEMPNGITWFSIKSDPSVSGDMLSNLRLAVDKGWKVSIYYKEDHSATAVIVRIPRPTPCVKAGDEPKGKTVLAPGKWYLHKSKVQAGTCVCSQEENYGANYEKIGGPYDNYQKCEDARKANANCK